MSRSRVTIRDVAAHVGVSHQTVSRVINGRDDVAPETRQRVEAAIAELEYHPNAIARFMAKGRTSTLACIALNLTDYTFAAIIDSAESECRRQGYFLLTASAPDGESFQALIEQMVANGRTDGLLIIYPYLDDFSRYLPAGFPAVFVGARPREQGIHSVILDDAEAGRQATRHLIARGHRRIAMITGPLAEDCSQDRCAGYEAALREAALPLDPGLVLEGDWSASSGYSALLQWQQDDNLPTAVFAQNDRMAVGVLRAARESKIVVPDQLAVIGVDDMPLASYFDPPLTTMRQDLAVMGREAVNLLLRVCANPTAPAQQIRLPAQLIARRST